MRGAIPPRPPPPTCLTDVDRKEFTFYEVNSERQTIKHILTYLLTYLFTYSMQQSPS